MTTEKAIRILETGIKILGIPHTVDDVDEACRMAISALRAQQSPAKLDRSRWEGCGYCSDPGDAEANEFLFCPYCGCPLTEEAWAEQKRRIGGNDGTTDIF